MSNYKIKSHENFWKKFFLIVPKMDYRHFIRVRAIIDHCVYCINHCSTINGSLL